METTGDKILDTLHEAMIGMAFYSNQNPKAKDCFKNCIEAIKLRQSELNKNDIGNGISENTDPKQ